MNVQLGGAPLKEWRHVLGGNGGHAVLLQECGRDGRKLFLLREWPTNGAGLGACHDPYIRLLAAAPKLFGLVSDLRYGIDVMEFGGRGGWRDQANRTLDAITGGVTI